MIYHSPEVYDKLGSGIEYAAKAVAPTIGPLGRNIAFDPKMDVPYVINSGREIVKHISFEDKAVMVGVDVIKKAMENAYLVSGDGAVATAVLIEKIWKEALRLGTAGVDSMAIMRGIRKASEAAISELKTLSDPVETDEDVRGLAKCAAAGRDDIADIIVEIYNHIGKNGYATVEDSQMAETHINYFKGVKWDKGFTGHWEEQSITMEKPYVLLINRVVKDFNDLAPVIQEARDKGRALLIIAREFKDDVANALHYVRDKAHVDVMGVVAPGYGEVRELNMKYFGIMFECPVFDEMYADVKPNMELSDCGHIEIATINKKETVLQGIPNPDDPLVEARRKQLYDDLLHIKDEDERYRIEQMLTPLAGDTANVFVGGVMEMEMFERKYLVDNALHNTYGAFKAGFLPGGGKGYMLAVPTVLKFAETLQGDEQIGAKMFADCLTSIAFQIAENAGFDGKNTVEKIGEGDKYFGLDVLAGEYTDLKKAGILDCADVVTTVINTAVSSVSTAISVAACVVAKDPEKEM